jgi:hypothetical protein
VDGFFAGEISLGDTIYFQIGFSGSNEYTSSCSNPVWVFGADASDSAED